MSDDADAPGLTLAELRTRSRRSQADLAERLSTTQSAVSRLERQHDSRVSTLAEYVAGLGGRLRLIAEHPDGDTELLVPALTPPKSHTPHRSRVVWQDQRTRRFHAVGWLESSHDHFRFTYTDAARRPSGFSAFEGLPDLDHVYESAELFAFFARQIPQTADPMFCSVVEALGLESREATPAELLRFPPTRPFSGVQLVPEPEQLEDGSIEGKFLVSGVRYADAETDGLAGKVIDRLRAGEPLQVIPEPSNPANSAALAISIDGVRLGYVPDYLLDDFRALETDGKSVRVFVERANQGDVEWHLRLLARFRAAVPVA